MFEGKERRISVHVTEARAGVCDLVVGNEGKKAKIVTLTGSRKPRNVIQVLRSFPATALVGIHRRRVPTCPCY